MCKHITLLLPNKPGQFFEAVEALHGDSRTSILGHSVNSEGRAVTLNLLCESHVAAYQVLSAKYKFYCTEKEVLVAVVDNESRSLMLVLDSLASGGINLSFSYQGLSTAGKAIVVLGFDSIDDLEKARLLLQEKQVQLLQQPL